MEQGLFVGRWFVMNLRQLMLLHAAAGGGADSLEDCEYIGKQVVFYTHFTEPIKEIAIPLTCEQSGSGNPTPSNVREITGASGVTLGHAALNLLDPSDLVNKNYGGSASSKNVRPENIIPVVPGANMVLKGVNVNQTDIRFYNKNGQLQSDYTISNYNVSIIKFTVPATCCYMRPKWYRDSSSLSIEEVAAVSMLYYGTEDISFVPYVAPESYQIAFPTLGKNLYNKVAYPITSGRMIIYNTGVSDTNNSYSATLGFIPCENIAGREITINKGGIGSDAGAAFYSSASESSFISGTKTGKTNAKWTLTVPSDAKYFRFTLNKSDADNVQIELGSTVSEYEPYINTCYGGTLKAMSGELTLTHVLLDVAAFSRSAWVRSSSHAGGYYIDIDDLPSLVKEDTPFVCSHGVCVENESNYLADTCYCDSSLNFWFMNENSQLEDWYDYLDAQKLAGTPVMVVAELETPITVQIDPTIITATEGYNTIWSDLSGTMTVVSQDKKSYELYNATLYPLTSGWINGGDGVGGSGASYQRTIDFVPCDKAAGRNIVLNKRPGGGNPGIAFYSSDSVSSFISGVKNNGASAGTIMIVAVPDTAQYMRFTVPAGATNVSVKMI